MPSITDRLPTVLSCLSHTLTTVTALSIGLVPFHYAVVFCPSPIIPANDPWSHQSYHFIMQLYSARVPSFRRMTPGHTNPTISLCSCILPESNGLVPFHYAVAFCQSPIIPVNDPWSHQGLWTFTHLTIASKLLPAAILFYPRHKLTQVISNQTLSDRTILLYD